MRAAHTASARQGHTSYWSRKEGPPVIGGDSSGPKVSHGKHPVGEVNVHGEKHQVVLKKVHLARPTVQSLEQIKVPHIPCNCSVSSRLPHNVLVDEGGHSQHLKDSWTHC